MSIKQLATLLILLFSTNSYCQFSITPEEVKYTEVIPIKGTSKADLYFKGREWYVDAFGSAEAVIQMEDKESGKIIGKGYSEFQTSEDLMLSMGDDNYTTHLKFTIRTYFKEGRTKIIFDNMTTAQMKNGKEQSNRPLVNSFFKANGKERKGKKYLRGKVKEIIIKTVESYKTTLTNTKDETW